MADLTALIEEARNFLHAAPKPEQGIETDLIARLRDRHGDPAALLYKYTTRGTR